MITIKLVLIQWQGILGYEIYPTNSKPSHLKLPDDLINLLLQAGLDMYIRRYLVTTVWHPSVCRGIKPQSAPYLVYHPNPHYQHQPLYLTTADNTLYELLVCFDNLAPLHHAN